MSKLFRTKEALTLAQLTRAWSPELVEGGGDPDQYEQDLRDTLLEDIVWDHHDWVLHRLMLMKEAVLDFAKRRHLPLPSWWAETLETSPQGTNEEAGGTVRIGISLRGKQARIIKYLAERFPNGVPEPAIQLRNQLKDDVLRTDPTLRPLDESTLKKSIDTYNASLGKQKSHPK